jgi:hypothetical protein
MNTANAERKPRRAHVWYNAEGTIIAVGHVPEQTEEGRHAPQRRAIPLTLENQFLLEAEVPEELIRELHYTHRVDVHTRTLVTHCKKEG